jgi:helicase MOV-10
MRQILERQPKARVLACAPSNSSADILADRLKDIGPSALCRLNAPSRSTQALLKTLEPFSKKNGKTFATPTLEELKKYRIVVSTCFSASVPYGMGLPRGHFDYVFIDEVGQALEPEAMIPIKTMAGPQTNIIVSGDPKQLGPIVRSPIASKLGLQYSYLDRLIARGLYADEHGRGVS